MSASGTQHQLILTDEIPALPQGWIWVRLGDIAEIVGGITKGQKRRPDTSVRAVPYLRVANVQRGYLDLTDVKEIQATEEEIQQLALRAGDMLFNEGGDRDKLGRGWVWQGVIPVCIHQNHVFRARPYLQDISPQFISYYANSDGQSYFFREGKQTTNLASINLTKLSSLPIPLAPAAEQHLITAEIEKHVTKIGAGLAALKRARANLKRYRAAVLKTACEGRLVPTEAELARREARSYETGEQLLARILQERRAKWEANQFAKMLSAGKPPKDDSWKKKQKEPVPPDITNLPALPEGWAWATMPQLGELNRGRSKHRPRNDPRLLGGPYPFIQTGDVKHSRGLIRKHTDTYTEFGLQQSRLWPEGTLCITIAANIAETGILTYPACFPDSVVGFLSDSSIVVRFVELFLRTAKQELARFAPATAQKNINLEVLSDVAVPLPPIAEQERIVMEVDRRFSLVTEVEAEMTRSELRVGALRQSVLKAAFEGKLVPQNPNDEPASVLLDRLRAERAVQAAGRRNPNSRRARSAAAVEGK